MKNQSSSRFHSSNYIHPTAIIDENVEIGKNNWIGPYCVLDGVLKIGSGNLLESHVCLGSSAEHKEYFWLMGSTKIGNNCIFREFTTVNAGTISTTKIENNVVMLRGSHVGHDCHIHEDVNISCSALVGGHSVVMNSANLGLGCAIHQRQVIGAFAMIGMNGVVTKDSVIKPGYIYAGVPVKKIKKNVIGLQRFKVTPKLLKLANEAYEEIRRKPY